MKNNYYLELEELKNENYKLRKELAKYKSSNENQFLNDNLENCYSRIRNLIEAEVNNGSKDYDEKYIRKHVEKLTI